MIPPFLPNVTFLCGGPLPLRTELANYLADITPGGQAHSFASPIRDGALGTFFMGDPSVDVSKLTDHPILPSENSPTFGQFIHAFSLFLPSFFANPGIIGLVARQRIEENRAYFSHFIFDDADTKENMRMVADLFGRQNALIVNMEEPGFTSRSMRVITIPSSFRGNPRDAADYLRSILAPDTAASPLPPRNPMYDLL